MLPASDPHEERECGMHRRTTGSGVCISASDTHFELFPSGRVKSLTEILFSCTFCVVSTTIQILLFSYSEVAEVHRTCETTATPLGEGANLSEETRTIRGFDMYSDPPMAVFLLCMFGCNKPGRGETAHSLFRQAADCRSARTEAGGASGYVRTALGRVRKSKAFSRSSGRSERESRWKSTFLLPSPSLRDIRIRCATRFRTRFWTH